MLKRIIMLAFSVFLMLQCFLCQAEKAFDEEDNAEVGTYFAIQAENMRLTVLSGKAEIVMRDGMECLFLSEIGDVLVNANFTVPEQPGKRFDYRLLLHVVKPEDKLLADEWLAAKESARKEALHPEQFPEQVLNLVNKERAKVGVRPLYLAADLQSAAQIRAKELTKLFSHTRPDGRPCRTALSDTWGIGENIAAGSETPEEVVEQWMNSPGHRRNILDSRYSSLGVGYCYDPEGVGGYTYYWVQMFRLAR